MWPANEFHESRPVALVLGEEKTKIEDLETSFLASISPVFKAMFYNGYAEAQKDTIEFPECDPVSTEKILNALKDAMREDKSVEDKIAEIITPKLYSTLLFLQIGSNLERSALSRMRFDELEEYKTLAEREAEGNIWLLKAIEMKTLTFFLKYRRTESFKKKSWEEFVAYLSHPYLEYRVEKEVLEAALFWLNYDFKNRKVHMKEVLSCVNWKRITKSQSKAACSLKIARKSTTLRDFFNGIYEKKSTNASLKPWDNFEVNLQEQEQPTIKGYKWAAEMLKDKTRKKRKYLLSVPFAFRETPEDVWTYGICIYNSKTEKFKEQVFLLPRNNDTNMLGFVNVKFFDFNVYSFMRSSSEADDPQSGVLDFKIEKHSTLQEGPQGWKHLGRYGQKGKLLMMNERDPAIAAEPIPEKPFPNVNLKASAVRRGTKMFIKLNGYTDTFDTYKETVASDFVFDDGKHGHTQESVAKEHRIQILYSRPVAAGQGQFSFWNNVPMQPLMDQFRNKGPLCAAFAKTISYRQPFEIFKNKLKTHVESKTNKNPPFFVIANELVQRVNPLWFKKFPQ